MHSGGDAEGNRGGTHHVIPLVVSRLLLVLGCATMGNASTKARAMCSPSVHEYISDMYTSDDHLVKMGMIAMLRPNQVSYCV